MPNNKPELRTENIPGVINAAMASLGVNTTDLKEGHILLKDFDKYSKWLQGGMQTTPPNGVIDLATYLYAIDEFSKSHQGVKKVAKLLKKKFSDLHEIKGLLFEFRSCIAFYTNHSCVEWSPNDGNMSEADIKVQHKNGATFWVECTSKKEKKARLGNERVIRQDILNSLKDKKDQSRDLAHPRIVAIYFPEQLELVEDGFRERLGRVLKCLFAKDRSYDTISAVTITSHTPIDVKVEPGRETYDTDLVSLSYKNENAKYALPPESINPNGL